MSETTVCQQCRESENWIWIESPQQKEVRESVYEERLCEPCYNALSRNGVKISVSGSQWKGEE